MTFFLSSSKIFLADVADARSKVRRVVRPRQEFRRDIVATVNMKIFVVKSKSQGEIVTYRARLSENVKRGTDAETTRGRKISRDGRAIQRKFNFLVVLPPIPGLISVRNLV